MGHLVLLHGVNVAGFVDRHQSPKLLALHFSSSPSLAGREVAAVKNGEDGFRFISKLAVFACHTPGVVVPAVTD